MPKVATGVGVETLVLDSSLALPLHRQLYAGVRDAILGGILKPGTRLLSTRSLAKDLEISRTTVILAFEQLLAEGYLECRVGDGTYVASVLYPGDKRRRRQASTERACRSPISRRASLLLRMGRRWVPQVQKPFALCGPAVEEFPFDVWRRLVSRQSRLGGTKLLAYGRPAGYGPLRRAVAAHVAAARGVRCNPEQIVILPSAQQALDLATRILLDPGQSVWVEDPGYPGALGAFLAAGAQVTPVPVDQDGISLNSRDRPRTNPRLIYVTPSHQFPLGMTMSLARRLELLHLARESDAWIIEDDYDSEYRYVGRPTQALQGLDTSGRVIYVGTFSKTMFPSLRLAYAVLPVELIDAFLLHRVLLDNHAPVTVQAAMAEFIEEGRLAAHIRQMRTLYGERRELFGRVIAERLGSELEIREANSGLHVTAWLRRKRDDEKLAREISRQGVEARPLSWFYRAGKIGRGLVLGYAGFSASEIKDGVRRMAKAF